MRLASRVNKKELTSPRCKSSSSVTSMLPIAIGAKYPTKGHSALWVNATRCISRMFSAKISNSMTQSTFVRFFADAATVSST
ncbi:hypothetical protein D3C84_1204470 [compost metagenome]